MAIDFKWKIIVFVFLLIIVLWFAYIKKTKNPLQCSCFLEFNKKGSKWTFARIFFLKRLISKTRL